MKINRNSIIYQIAHRCAKTLGRANVQALFGPKSWAPQTDYNPVDPNKRSMPELDSRPEAVEAREKAARNAIWIPLAAILGGAAALAIGVIIKLYF